MARLGRYEYPEIPLGECVELGRAIVREFGGRASRGGLARFLSMSDRGGAFAARLGALRQWGVATGRGDIQLTQEGLRAASPRSNDEAQVAMASLAASVPLFAELCRRIGGRGLVHDRRLGVALEEITGADRLDVDARLPLLRRLYEDVAPYLADSGGGGQGQARPFEVEPQALGSESAELSDASPGRIELSFSGGRISLPESAASIDAAILVLRARRAALAGAEAKTAEPPTA